MKKIVLTAAMTIIAATGAEARVPAAPTSLKYPQAPSDPTVVDNYYGIKLADPFRPLENDTAAATLEWVKAENALTRGYIDAIPYRTQLRDRLSELYNFRRLGMPWKGNDGMYYVSDNDGLQNQNVIYRSKKPTGKREVFLDPNKLSDNGTVALTGIGQSPSGRYTSYTISRNGSDWTEIFVMDTKSKKLMKDHIEWAKFTDAVWNGDDGFFYSAYERPEEGKEFSSANMGHRVWYHKLGTDQEADTVVYQDKHNPLYFHSAYVPEGQPLLFIIKSGAGNGEAIIMKRLDNPDAGWIEIEPTQRHSHHIIDVADGKIYIISDENAPKGRIMVADVDNPVKSAWRELVPEAKGVLKGATFAGNDRLLLTYEQDASDHVVAVSAKDGSKLGDIATDGYGTIGLSAGKKSGDDIFYSFTSFTCPTAVYSYNLSTGKRTTVAMPQVKGVDFSDYVTEQVFFTSSDGTRVPMFLTYKKGLKRDSRNPVYLYGYGGFNSSLTPNYNPARLLWLENGGIYAHVNLRGGSEYGEEWHRAGTKMEKVNVFNDFIAAAEYMIDQKWTTNDLIVAEGASNGGLLVGAVVNMRPDLFKVAIPRVGVMDMMRYHLFTIGWNWAPDYGRSDDGPAMAKYLLGYSPLHNIRGGGLSYPAILVTTADHDDRVVPAHSFKYAATLQEADTGNAPKLIRIDSNAGHGAGKPVSKSLDEWADIYSFIFYNMDIVPGE